MILQPSKYLVNVQLNSKFYICYHSLFGGAVKVKKDVVDLIKRFKGGIDFNRHFSKDEKSTYKDTILTLKKQYFLVEKGIDGRSLLKIDNKIFKEALVAGRLIDSLRLEMASYCNFRCQHCFAPKIYNWKKGAEMSFDTAKLAVDGFLDILKKTGNNKGEITFWGGEPLLNWKVIKQIVEYVDEVTKNSLISIVSGIITNGSLLNSQILKFMQIHGMKARVSLDGLERENDRFRKFTNGRGTFKSIIKGMDGLYKHNIPFSVELCLNNYNFGSVERVIEFIYDKYKCKSFVVSPIDYQTSVSNFDCHSNEEKAKRFVEIYDYGIKKGIGINPADSKDLLKKTIDQHPPMHACRGLFKSLYVKPSGSVHSCHQIIKPLGTIKEIKEIPQGKNYKYVAMREVGKIKGCKGCEIEGICAGGCAGVAEFYSGNIYDTSHSLFQHFYCDLRRYLVKELLKYGVKKEIP